MGISPRVHRLVNRLGRFEHAESRVHEELRIDPHNPAFGARVEALEAGVPAQRRFTARLGDDPLRSDTEDVLARVVGPSVESRDAGGVDQSRRREHVVIARPVSTPVKAVTVDPKIEAALTTDGKTRRNASKTPLELRRKALAALRNAEEPGELHDVAEERLKPFRSTPGRTR